MTEGRNGEKQDDKAFPCALPLLVYRSIKVRKVSKRCWVLSMLHLMEIGIDCICNFCAMQIDIIHQHGKRNQQINKQTQLKTHLRWLWKRLALSWKYTDLFSLLTFVHIFLVPARYKNNPSCQVLNRNGMYQHTRSVPENRNNYKSGWGLHIS